MKRRKRNPVPPSQAVKIERAVALYDRFSGHAGEVFAQVDALDVPGLLTNDTDHALIVVGKLDGVMYETVRDGRTEKYVHEFANYARPLLATSHDGRSLYILGGGFRFTERGIVDRRRRK
jgi:hypothetical protein